MLLLRESCGVFHARLSSPRGWSMMVRHTTTRQYQKRKNVLEGMQGLLKAGIARERVMVRDDPTWQATTAQFYGQLYACVSQSLEPFLGAATTHELLSLGLQALHEAYPFLVRLQWSTAGLDPTSLAQAMATEERAHVEAGCEQLLQQVQALTREIGGALLAQRLCAATEQLRLAFE